MSSIEPISTSCETYSFRELCRYDAIFTQYIFGPEKAGVIKNIYMSASRAFNVKAYKIEKFKIGEPSLGPIHFKPFQKAKKSKKGCIFDIPYRINKYDVIVFRIYNDDFFPFDVYGTIFFEPDKETELNP